MRRVAPAGAASVAPGGGRALGDRWFEAVDGERLLARDGRAEVETVDHQPGLALHPGKLSGAHRAAELAVPGPAAREEAETRAAGELELGADDRVDALGLRRLDQLDRPIQAVAIAETEGGDSQPGGRLHHVPG